MGVHYNRNVDECGIMKNNCLYKHVRVKRIHTTNTTGEDYNWQRFVHNSGEKKKYLMDKK